MRIIIVANSPYKNFNMYKHLAGDILIGVDVGAASIIDEGYQLDVAIGDFDTTSRIEDIKKNAVVLIEHSPIKDEIDLELVFKYILENFASAPIYIYNATMGRLDHELITIKLLIKYKMLNITLINESEEIRYITSSFHFSKSDIRFSLISFDKVILSINNAEYNLDKTVLSINDNYTSSNHTKDNTIINIYDGGVILINEIK